MKFYFTLIIISLALSGCQIGQSIIDKPISSPDSDTDICDINTQGCLEELVSQTSLVFPIDEFKERITKKPFGIYIIPKNSPIQPERFAGYHTGADVEYTDKLDEVIPVVAIADGQVVYSGLVSGYGGVVIIKHVIDSQNYQILYGHLAPSSLIKKDAIVTPGKQIGVLGKGETTETNGERKHLHFSVYTGTDLNFKGYVQDEKDLKQWIDPLKFF